MAMDNMSIRKAQLEKLDEFVHNLYKEVQTFKSYGIDLSDVEMMYLHIHELIVDLLECDTTDEFMEKLAELHKGIAGVLIIAIPSNAQQVADELKGAHEAMSDMDVNDFLKNMKVQEKTPTPKQQAKQESPPQEEEIPLTEEERQDAKDKLVKTLNLEDQVSASKPKPKRDWDKPTGEEQHDDDKDESDSDNSHTEYDPVDNKSKVDPLNDLWEQWKTN